MQKIITIALLCATIIACNSSGGNKVQQSADLSNISLTVCEARPADSIKTYNDSLSFDYYDLGKLDADTLLAFQYPLLNLSLLDTNGNFLREISRKGRLLENFQGSFITSQWDKQNNLYLLEEGNNFSIAVFDNALKFRYRVNLVKSLPDNFVFPLSTSFHLVEEDGGVKRIYMSSGDIRYNVFSEEYYTKANSLISFRLDSTSVSEVKHHLPFNTFDAVKSGISGDSRAWNTPVVFFDMNNDKGFLKYKFDDNIYICGRDALSIEQVIPLKLQWGKDRAYTTSFGNARKTQFESAKEQLLLQYANINYNGIKVAGNKAYVLYTKPIPQSEVPDNPNQTSQMDISPVLHIVDLEDPSKQYSVEFSPKYNAREFSVDQKGNVFLSSNPMKEENSYIYKFTIDFHGK
ncbi:hypothetical protein MKQ70_14775 [Chitinophaga sedimenti]|uniref:hypothetical protein n=1 Tax=Chitinophaga sedimenti TaxID=2033606 RepID=UPI0020046D03|nr:hypothetical protein [Chitinophaga sedimenti]MCK7556209.1 hypothetical protein [Chitinophaga sedimenti]